MAPTAPDALLCGDPARALAIAQRVLVQPVMSNHNRGLWGYHGVTPAGAELTVQATGIGGPSAAAVLAELLELGARRLIRIGTCLAPGPEPALGTGLVVEAALAGDGTSVALGAPAGEPVLPDPELSAALRTASRVPAAVVASADLLAGGGHAPGGPAATVRDLQSAAVLWAAREAGVAAAAALTVASADGRHLEDDPLEAAQLRLADAAASAFATAPAP